jgi:hypothetical protein
VAEYPEHEKLKLVKDRSQAIGEFLDWLSDVKDWHLGYHVSRIDALLPASYNIQRLLAEYFEIDLDKLEAEKLAIIEEMRQMNAARTG